MDSIMNTLLSAATHAYQ